MKTHQKCSNCFKTKEASEFYTRGERLQSRCKACNPEVVKAYRLRTVWKKIHAKYDVLLKGILILAFFQGCGSDGQNSPCGLPANHEQSLSNEGFAFVFDRSCSFTSQLCGSSGVYKVEDNRIDLTTYNVGENFKTYPGKCPPYGESVCTINTQAASSLKADQLFLSRCSWEVRK